MSNEQEDKDKQILIISDSNKPKTAYGKRLLDEAVDEVLNRPQEPKEPRPKVTEEQLIKFNKSGKPHRFQNGHPQIRNPNRSSPSKSLAKYIREHTDNGKDLVKFLIGIVKGDDVYKPSKMPIGMQNRLLALTILEKRGWGNIPSTHIIEGDVNVNFTFLDVLKLRAEMDEKESLIKNNIIDVTPENNNDIQNNELENDEGLDDSNGNV